MQIQHFVRLALRSIRFGCILAILPTHKLKHAGTLDGSTSVGPSNPKPTNW